MGVGRAAGRGGAVVVRDEVVHAAVHLWFDRAAASEMEAPNALANLV